MFCNLQDEDEDDDGGKEESLPLMGLGELLRRVVTPVSPSNSQIVGFGRAVSDFGLTASIYDVMVSIYFFQANKRACTRFVSIL